MQTNIFSRMATCNSLLEYDKVLNDISLYVSQVTTIDWEHLDELNPDFFSLSSKKAEKIMAIVNNDFYLLYSTLADIISSSSYLSSNIFDVNNYLKIIADKSDTSKISEIEKIIETEVTNRNLTHFSTQLYRSIIQYGKQIVRIITHPEENIREKNYVALHFVDRLSKSKSISDIRQDKLARIVTEYDKGSIEVKKTRRILHYVKTDFPRYIITNNEILELQYNPMLGAIIHNELTDIGANIQLNAFTIAMTEDAYRVESYAQFLLLQQIARERHAYCFYAGRVANSRVLMNENYYRTLNLDSQEEALNDLISLIYYFHESIGKTTDCLDYDLEELLAKVPNASTQQLRSIIANIYRDINIIEGV